MDPSFPAEAQAFRVRVQAFLRKHLPDDWHGLGAIQDRDQAERFVDDWRVLLRDNGLLGVHWPTQYGGAGLSKL